MEQTIQKLCRQYTDLTDEEIQIIEMMARTLQPLANLESADIFIDCPCGDDNAIVVAEAKPEDVPSSYKNSVVGMLAKSVNEPAVARTFRLGISTKHMKALTQESTHTIQSVEPIKYGSRVIGVLICEKRMDEEDGKSEFLPKGYESVSAPIAHIIEAEEGIADSIDEALLLIDNNGKVSFRNLFARELYSDLGYVEDVLGQMYDNICLVRLEDPEDINEDSFMEITMGNYYLSIRHIPLGRPDIRFAVIIRDVTWQKEQEKALILKSVAIKELHHRVKNNLQTIASLLRLQMRRTENEETIQALTESASRVLSIASTHQLLAQSGVDEVKIKEVITNIKNNAVRPFVNPNFNVEILIEGDDFLVDSDISTSVSLIINELIQNSLKYAFRERKQGRIEIRIKKGSLYSSIQVMDDGVGFDVEHMRQDRLGLTIVKSLVEDKLHGDLEIKSGPEGTLVTFDFLSHMIDIVSVT